MLSGGGGKAGGGGAAAGDPRGGEKVLPFPLGSGTGPDAFDGALPGNGGGVAGMAQGSGSSEEDGSGDG